MTDYNLKTKGADGKYITLGNFKKNQWGNFTVGLKNDPKLIEMLASKPTGGWINLAAFPIDPPKPEVAEPIDDEVPF